jgi:ABC-type uncharacterized transport system involved in gliding motility auxiliary subunit
VASRASWLAVALFALLAGAAFVVSLNTFLDQSRQALAAPPPEPINVTQLLIRPFLVRAGLAALLVLPLVTARTRTFSHAVKTCLLMLIAPAVLCAALFAFGAPEWGPLVSGFLGLLLIGIAFIAVGLLVSSLSTSAGATAVATLSLSIALVAFRDVFIGGVLDDFAKGVIDIGYIVSCLMVVALALFLARQTLRRAQADRGNQFHAGVAWVATVQVAAVAGLVAIIMLSRTSAPRWDVTAAHLYQLSPETRAALRTLDAPVRIRVVAQAARDHLKEYAAASRFIRIDEEADIQDSGSAVIEYRGRTERIKTTGEQDLTNALVRLREGRTRKIYFTGGHAERDTASGERAGYSGTAAMLQRENFVVDTINIAVREVVPPDASLVIVAGPRADFFRAEIEALERYVDGGGAVLFLVDPFEDLKRYITESGTALFMMDPATVSRTGELRNLTAFIRQHGAELGNDVVVDTGQMGQFLGTDASVPVAAGYPPHPITNGLTSLTAYPMARSVNPLPQEGMRADSIIRTGDQAWAETNLEQLGSGHPSLDPARGDRHGPVSLGVAIAAPKSRLVVVGDSDFIANYSATVPGNAEMFLSIVRWLVQDKVVSIPPRAPQERTLAMGTSQQRMLMFLALVLLPGVAAGAAFVRRSFTARAVSRGTG